MTEQFCLKWNDFQENTNAAFGSLRNDSDFSDVTLACEDGQQVEAHKIILASSSPVFMNLLRQNKHSHPLIYMRGVKSEDLVTMVDFLYFGEANINQDQLDSFLTLACELKIKGLSDNKKEAESIDKGSKTNKQTVKQEETLNLVPQEIISTETYSHEDMVETEPPMEGTLDVYEATVAVDLQDLDAKVKSMMGKSENLASDNNRARVCKVCGKEGQWVTIRDHIEAHHITGVSHSCKLCGKSFKSRNSLRYHSKSH